MTKLLLRANCLMHHDDVERKEKEITTSLVKQGFAIIDNKFEVYEILDEEDDK